MPAPTLDLPFPDYGITLRVDEPSRKEGLRATVAVHRHGEDGALLPVPAYADRVNLDRQSARTAFAAAGGIDEGLLLVLRERVLEWLTPASTEPAAAERAELDDEATRRAEALLDAPWIASERSSPRSVTPETGGCPSRSSWCSSADGLPVPSIWSSSAPPPPGSRSPWAWCCGSFPRMACIYSPP
jgi:hypothetical protein